MANWR
jgi:hypothetical protein